MKFARYAETFLRTVLPKWTAPMKIVDSMVLAYENIYTDFLGIHAEELHVVH